MTWNTPLGRYLAENDVMLRDAASLTGLSISALSLLARGKRRATPRTMVKIARGLGVPLRQVFDVSAPDVTADEALSELLEVVGQS